MVRLPHLPSGSLLAVVGVAPRGEPQFGDGQVLETVFGQPTNQQY